MKAHRIECVQKQDKYRCFAPWYSEEQKINAVKKANVGELLLLLLDFWAPSACKDDFAEEEPLDMQLFWLPLC